jgi:YegS/Rv2252/BmrU family lipid kinase
MYKHIHVIINPAAGADKPVLSILNTAFQPGGIDWDVFVTKKAGDARRLAQQAVAAGVDAVAAYGGDGTVMEVISGLIGSQTPLAILPGGTGNGASFELHIPIDLSQACALLTGDDSEVREVDVGQIGDNYFLLNAGVGFATSMMEGAERSSKDRLGLLAYFISGIQTLRDPPIARYHLLLDGKQVESEGVSCLIANSGALGSLGVKLAPNIDISDGMLDVVIIRTVDLGNLLTVAASVITGTEDFGPMQHWQAREVTLVTDPPQTVQLDGDVLGTTPFTARVLSRAARIIVPRAPLSQSSAIIPTANDWIT